MRGQQKQAISRSLGASLLLWALLDPGALAWAQEVVPSPRFDIQRFEITGNTLLSSDEIERIVAPFTGSQKGLADVQGAVKALDQGYRERGFGVVQVLLPEQTVNRSVIQIRVTEPRVSRVLIGGNKHFDNDNVRYSLPTVKEGETPNSHRIARNLQMLGEHPLKQTQVLLRSGAAEGQVDVNVKVDDNKPWRIAFTLDDTGTSDTGYLRSGIGYQHTNLFNRDHTLTAQYITSPTYPSRVSIYGLGYRIPFYHLNGTLDLIAGYSDVASGTVQGLFSVSGSGTIFGARWGYFLPKWGELEQKATLGIDYRAFKNDVTLAGVGLVPDITIHPVSLVYSGILRQAASQLNFHAGVSTNIPGGDDGRSADFQAARTGATANYTIFRYGLHYAHAFQKDWQMRAAYNGQYTSDSLVPGEQLGLGGPDSVRGYLLREVSGDRGYAAQLELQTPDLARLMGAPDDYRARLIAFYDFGSVQRNNAFPSEQQSKFIASTGVGVRFNYSKSVNLRFDVAQILKDAGTRQSSNQRISAGLALIF
ncbi:MAG: ShlB/FhaC/HecB family hemolysin secretion/activation protein [Pseudomonadota bacterium]|mgnify:CR=1 FL=1